MSDNPATPTRIESRPQDGVAAARRGPRAARPPGRLAVAVSIGSSRPAPAVPRRTDARRQGGTLKEYVVATEGSGRRTRSTHGTTPRCASRRIAFERSSSSTTRAKDAATRSSSSCRSAYVPRFGWAEPLAAAECRARSAESPSPIEMAPGCRRRRRDWVPRRRHGSRRSQPADHGRSRAPPRRGAAVSRSERRPRQHVLRRRHRRGVDDGPGAGARPAGDCPHVGVSVPVEGPGSTDVARRLNSNLDHRGQCPSVRVPRPHHGAADPDAEVVHLWAQTYDREAKDLLRCRTKSPARSPTR